MFERYITDALTTHFGHIVENVDADKMRLSAWNGELVLDDVSLKTDALDSFFSPSGGGGGGGGGQACPVEIAYGHVGKCHVKIPWSLLSSQWNWQKEDLNQRPLLLETNCSIVLTDVNILITPRRKIVEKEDEEDGNENNAKAKPNKEQEGSDGSTGAEATTGSLEARRAEKERQVQDLLDASLLQRVTESSLSKSRGWAWLQDWLSSVLSTLSVTVRNIHIRYEDPGTSMGFEWKIYNYTTSNSGLSDEADFQMNRPPREQRYRPAFAVGITLKEFSIRSGSEAKANTTIQTKQESSVVEESNNAETSSTVETATLSSNTTQDASKSASSGTKVLGYMTQYKLAAADNLAVYWDSDTSLVSVRAHDNRQNEGRIPTKMELFQYYQSCFEIFNDGQDAQHPKTALHKRKHSYLLNPISPSMHLTLVSKKPIQVEKIKRKTRKVKTGDELASIDVGNGHCDGDDGDNSSVHLSSVDADMMDNDHYTPPSSLRLDLPPCKFTVARSTLEDTVYFRKSLSIWTHVSKTLLSERTLRRLAKLRPPLSPLQDPTSWWLYAFEATKVLTRVTEQGNDAFSGSSVDVDSPRPLLRRKGWRGLVQAVSRRRKYSILYKKMIEAAQKNDMEAERSAHWALFAMEDELLSEEIVSFRIYVYETLSKVVEGHDDGNGRETSTPITSTEDTVDGRLVMSKGETNDDILSIKHRRWMFNEMKQALDREQANKQRQHMDELHRASVRDRSLVRSEDQSNPVVWAASVICREVAIQINDEAIGRYAHDHHRHRMHWGSGITPVVRISSAWVQDHLWYHDGSWDANCSLGSLEVKDLISARGKSSGSRYLSTLLGRRTHDNDTAGKEDEYLLIKGIRYSRNIAVTVTKRLHWRTGNDEDFDRGSTTTTKVRVLPMELVYSTLPAEAVSRVLSTVQTPEIVDDYHKVLAAASSWKEEQKNKLLEALAHKDKKIIVDVDIGAPELLIPEDVYQSESPMLAINLGRFQSFNDDETLTSSNVQGFDDQWRVIVSDVQVRNTTIGLYYSSSKSHHQHQLVEPFSIDFVVSTKISDEDQIQSMNDLSRINVTATLPWLAFNVTSSSIRLVSRLQRQWEQRRREMLFDFELFQAPGSLSNSFHLADSRSQKMEPSRDTRTSTMARKQATAGSGRLSRIFTFNFSAPVISLKLANDVDGRNALQRNGVPQVHGRPMSTPLFDLSLRSISGKVVQEVGRDGGSKTQFDASLQSLGVIDQYQTAGEDYVLLLSSVPQSAILDEINDGTSYSWEKIHESYNAKEATSGGKDLVSIEYTSTASGQPSGAAIVNDDTRSPDKLAVSFHELYVQWNPETLAAIQKAIRVPINNGNPRESSHSAVSSSSLRHDWSSDDEEFFDAMEEQFYDADGSDDESVRTLSEISSSAESEWSLAAEQNSQTALGIFTSIRSINSLTPDRPLGCGFFSSGLVSSPGSQGSPLGPRLSQSGRLPSIELPALHDESRQTSKPSPLEVTFDLSKLRVSFNRETRHRKVMVAQMDRTFVSYASTAAGGSKTTMSIGNLVFVDPSHEDCNTLYGQILGLKTDAGDLAHNTPSSLLQMEILLNPWSRDYTSTLDDIEMSSAVKIDRVEGKMEGSDCCIGATFSPMRFVLLEQLWFEIMDYFFQGIMGAEVWTGQRLEPAMFDASKSSEFLSMLQGAGFLPGSDANGISFTRFDVLLDAPVILLPVTYSSPEFVRLELSQVRLSNKYSSIVVNDTALGVGDLKVDRMQWFNNCEIALNELRLFTWSGLELGKQPIVGNVTLRWPTGPLGHFIIPKWNIICTFESLDISLRRYDYALLQNIVSHNIGEPSRYMDEWELLQSLAPDALQGLMEGIMVHFGYDKKDVTPTTYDMTIQIPSLKFGLLDGDKLNSVPVAVARCFDLKFQMHKEADLVSKQSVTCDMDLVYPDGNGKFEKLISLSKYSAEFEELDKGENDNVPGLVYMSTTRRSGDNIKTVEVTDACIYMVVPAWSRFTSFFKSIASPILLNRADIGTSIQIGDRWYRIGDSGEDGGDPSISASAKSQDYNALQRYNWIVGEGAGLPQETLLALPSPTTQMRILLTWPRIVISSTPPSGLPNRIVLRMHHLEFLRTNNPPEGSVTTSLLVHDVEVYTSSRDNSTLALSKDVQNSLINPWCLSAAVDETTGREGDCDKHTYKLSGDVLRARAAYSDMAIAVDIFLSVLHATKEEDLGLPDEPLSNPIFSGSFDSADPPEILDYPTGTLDNKGAHSNSAEKSFSIQCDGFEVVVSDDSGRHFAGSHDLVILTLDSILLSRLEATNGDCSMHLRLQSLDLYDCLQPANSPFAVAASSHSNVMGLQNSDENRIDSPELPAGNAISRIQQRRAISWAKFRASNDSSWNYVIAPAFVERVNKTADECTHLFFGDGEVVSIPGLVELSSEFSGGSLQQYDLKLRSFAVQWNPSTIIAIQRFLGRLRKESRDIAEHVFHKDIDDLLTMGDGDVPPTMLTESEADKNLVVIRANVDIDSLTVCLNKEHQNRRLLEMTFSSCSLNTRSSDGGMFAEGRIGNLSVVDSDKTGTDPSITAANRSVVMVLPQDGGGRQGNQFLRVVYQTFSRQATSSKETNERIAGWVMSHLQEQGDIDDYLSLSVAATRFTYIKERTEEILDYLSNGLPGKGMGVTSRAAKGFISKRIQTKSFLEIQVDSPQVYVPRHDMAQDGLALKLGDVNIKSWFEAVKPTATALADTEWFRVLSLKLSGFRSGFSRVGSDFEKLSSACKSVDLDILLRKATTKGSKLTVNGGLSSLEMTLDYSDYVLLRAVMSDNLGRRVDTEKWDNIEKAYWMEEESADELAVVNESFDASSPRKQNRVVYSTNARFVRYGEGGKRGRKKDSEPSSDQSPSLGIDASSNVLDLRFDMGGLSLKFRRDDLVYGILETEDLASAFHYDVMLLRVGTAEIVASATAGGNFSFNASFFHLGLFDLGDTGRLIRERYFLSLPDSDSQSVNRNQFIRQPCPFQVLVEGYQSEGSDSPTGLATANIEGPQFVITVDTCLASSTTGFGTLSESGLPPETTVTVARIVINHLSVNALIRPFREIADFISCEWPTPLTVVPSPSNNVKAAKTEGGVDSLETGTVETTGRGFQLKLVAHYPRVFFLADESDANSRALVLRGLAVVNVSDIKRVENTTTRSSDSVDVQNITVVNAQLHGMETYINPDVSVALRFSQRHGKMVGDEHMASFPAVPETNDDDDQDYNDDDDDVLGVALIQPVTTGIEYRQTRRELFPTTRSLFVNIEPVSTMLSFEDLQLIEIVLNRWLSGRTTENPATSEISPLEQIKESKEPTPRNDPLLEHFVEHKVVFASDRLGLGLGSEKESAEKENVIVTSVQNQHCDEVLVRDRVVAVGEADVRGLALDDVVELLSTLKRPIAITFERAGVYGESKQEESDVEENGWAPLEEGEENSATEPPVICYSLHFRSGLPLGMDLERSACGQFPVVSRVKPTIDHAMVMSNVADSCNPEQFEIVESTYKEENTRLPRVGAIIVAVDGVLVDELGVEESWEALSRLQRFDPLGESVQANLQTAFSLTFQEINQSVWGKIDSVDISTSGIALSFIDDLNGRDMPLFRGQVNSLDIHVDRGLGIEAHILDYVAPTLLSPLDIDLMKGESSVVLSQDLVQEIQTESILSISCIGRCSMDYFHPRSAYFEPLLEPSQIFFLFEKQGGSVESNRPAQVALEVADRLLRDQCFRGNATYDNYLGEPQMVALNLTDAAAEVIVEASKRWKEWRSNVSLDENEINEDIVGDIKLQESGVSSERVLLTSISTDPSEAGTNTNQKSPNKDEAQSRYAAQRAAAKKAAQAALVFAQKRGAEPNQKSDSAKPFVFQNRTGVSIAFVQQGRGLKRRRYQLKGRRSTDLDRSLSTTIGEYSGLADYNHESITELADQEDARFDIDFADNEAEEDARSMRSVRHITNKVRSYEGRYPDLTVAIQAVTGVLVEPLTDLPVYKVGSTVRHLNLCKDSESGAMADYLTHYTINLVWKVEIEDNRRILTLSTAIRVVSSGFSMPIEVGVRRNESDNESSLINQLEQPTRTVGIARSESPLYMPLWLALKLEPVSIFIRPFSSGVPEYAWSESSILHFGSVKEDDTLLMLNQPHNVSGNWTWEKEFNELNHVRCISRIGGEQDSIWLSVFGTQSPQNGTFSPKRSKRQNENPRDEIELEGVLTVACDSGLTIRNFLPMSIEWEVIQVTDFLDQKIFQGASRRTVRTDSPGQKGSRGKLESHFEQFAVLKSGECTEVLGCSYGETSFQARFKQVSGKSWSTWAPLKLDEMPEREDDFEGETDEEALFPSPTQVNVQIRDDNFGTPLVFGVRVVPKTTKDNPLEGRVYGLEVIVYAELWIRNITMLPLNFGCPTYQLHKPAGQTLAAERTEPEDLVTRFAAESALMEIASLLEVGDKGTGLNQKAARRAFEAGLLESLPNQECPFLVEEVFEYIEIENSLVRRRWYGSESYDSYREMIVGVNDDQSNWKWIDENWAIDCSGGAKPSFDGWESCRNLLAEDGSFGSKREFKGSHAFRRRRFFRSRNTEIRSVPLDVSFQAAGQPTGVPSKRHMGGIQAVHQPLNDSFSRQQTKLKRIQRKGDGENDKKEERSYMKIAVKCGDGTWSSLTTIPDSGTCHGVVSVFSSRWPELTRLSGGHSDGAMPAGLQISRKTLPQDRYPESFVLKSGCLDAHLHELCYTVSDVDGEWGEFSRSMEVSPRFFVRNDSKIFSVKLKQTGSSDSSAMTLLPGEAGPFFWADFRLPKLVSVVPLESYGSTGGRAYKWSGGFDLCNLGMTPVRIRREPSELNKTNSISSVRVLVEVRSGTGGFGINVSVREEDPDGEGSLFRIENKTPFPIWLAQDGILANPMSPQWGNIDDVSHVDGDILAPFSKTVYALDVPYRQGKYANRKEASMSELMQVRTALAPLSSRAGVETVKVLGLAIVGDSIRLNPSNLPLSLTDAGRSLLFPIRALGIVATDGPTRVLRFCLMSYSDGDNKDFVNPFDGSVFVNSNQDLSRGRLVGANRKDYCGDIAKAAVRAIRISQAERLPTELDAKRKALLPNMGRDAAVPDEENAALDTIFSFRAEFTGFIFSLVDSAPSEIAVASLRNFNILARWNALRSTDASMIFSIGWLQVDNHVPSAPFKVAVRPNTSARQVLPEDRGANGGMPGVDKSPLLVIALAFAPKHKSEILVLRSVTVAPRNLVIALDLAFLVRLQRFFMGLQERFSRKNSVDAGHLGLRSGSSSVFTENKRTIPFPLLESPEQKLAKVGDFNENQKLYFQGLTILPTNIKLSVAPARALTSEQAGLEGTEAAAIHQAVRKGDVLVGSSTSGPLGVRVGRKNKTPLAVIRGVFKSIVVDALLRLDGANLNFPGVFLRNHIFTGSQLTTYLLAHYISSLKNNVPALLGSLAAIGNPLGLIRGIGDGVSDFVSEPVKGFKRSLKELDPGYVVDGVARGTESLARHTVGGLADSASLLTETFSKYMAVVTLDRRYAQKRDRRRSLRMRSDSRVTLAGGVESGFTKLIQGFRDGVTGVVKAPMRGAEKRGFEGFAKGLGKGLLGLLVKPIIGISDAATDLMIGVKSTVEYKEEHQQSVALLRNQLRPRRPMYGRDKVLRPYRLEDAAAATLMLRTRCAGENYLSHMDMNDRVALLSGRRLIILGPLGEEVMQLKYRHVDRLEVRPMPQEDGSEVWGIVVVLNTPRRNGSEVEVISCHSHQEAVDLCALIQQGIDLVTDNAMAA